MTPMENAISGAPEFYVGIEPELDLADSLRKQAERIPERTKKNREGG